MSERNRPVAWVIAPSGARTKIGPSQIGYLIDLVVHGPHLSVTAWVRHHLGYDHGYRREDVWRYVRSGMAQVEEPSPIRDRHGRPRSYGPVSAPPHTAALVHWWLGRLDVPDLGEAVAAGWVFVPGTHSSASGRTTLGMPRGAIEG
jgi:hypothetical protein